MPQPLLSVVIPTASRPDLLPFAVTSALDLAGGDVEVIVVPNGIDTSWKQSLGSFASDQRLRVEPIDVPHANAARNHGLRLAHGRYVRFLDDDDYFYSDAATRQIESLESSGADISSGAIDLVDAKGVPLKRWEQPITDDLVQAVYGPRRVTLPTAYVFRRSALVDMSWDESVMIGQDTHWMFSLVNRREFQLCRALDAVGVWRQHAAFRTSATTRTSIHFDISAELLLASIKLLEAQQRMNDARRATAAAGLWNSIHGAYFRNPVHWAKVMRTTLAMFPGSRPDIRLYSTRIGRCISPLVLETAATPKRWVNYLLWRHAVRSGRRMPW